MTKVVPFSATVSTGHDSLTSDEAWLLDHIEEDIDNIVHYTDATRADLYRFLLRKCRQDKQPFSMNIVSRFETTKRLPAKTTERFIIQRIDQLPQTSEYRKYHLLMLLAQRVRSKVRSSVTLRAIP